MYVYRTEYPLHFVGHYDEGGAWCQDSEHDLFRTVTDRVHELNRAEREVGSRTGATRMVFEKNDDGFWTVGSYTPNGRWEPVFDSDDPQQAERWVAWLNGEGDTRPDA